MPKIIVLVGPPGSGKSTLAKDLIENDGDIGAATVRISQDDQGKQGHIDLFWKSLEEKKNIIIDRMGFSIEQRNRYLHPAKEAGYETEIVVLHAPYQVCLERCLAREGHPTIKEEKDARNALNTFFGKYDRVQDNDADKVARLGWDGYKLDCCVIDIDGTLANIDHRLHFMKKEGKKNWPGFFDAMDKDSVNSWCLKIMDSLETRANFKIVLASGRPDSYKKVTETWLSENNIQNYNHLFMRPRNDSRQDYIVKEIILDFEILTRYKPLFFVDDRKQVVDLWRKRGFVCLACAEGDF